METVRLDFGNLPLIEAAVRASFHGPAALTYAVVNSVATRLKPEFPALTEPQQLEIAPGIGVSPAELGPGLLPGAVYGGHNAGLTVSVHSQVIVARWVKYAGPVETRYPRYPALRDSLWNAVEAFREGVGDEFPSIAVVNMSYVNFLPISGAASNVRSYFSDQAQITAMDDAHQVRKIEAAWSEGEGLDVRYALEQVTARLGDGVREGYRLTTAAGIRVVESLDAKSALERVHVRLQGFFLDLISAKAKQEWRLTEEQRA